LSLRLRLALFGAAVVALTVLLFGALLYALLARGVGTNQDDAVRTRAVEAVASLAATNDLAPRGPVAPADLARSTDVFVEVVSTDGSVIYSTAVAGGAPPLPSAALLAQATRQHGAFATQGGLRLYALPFAGGYVVSGQSKRVPQSSLSGVLGFLIISAVPTLIAALAASWLVAGRALKPLKDVAGAADEIGRTRDFGRRLARRPARDEVALLAASFNRMLDQLQEAFESQRRFVADASHELRTPLTTIQGNAGLLASGPSITDDTRHAAAADIAAESARMARLVDRLLTLARADAGLSLELAPLGLKRVVDEVGRQASAVHAGRNLDSAAEEATVAADEDAIRQLVWILLDNAFRYARSRVGIALRTEDGWARLTVTDDGPGIAPEERERVFERFYRADRSRTGQGAGLGLSIARWIADQHHGRILAGASPEGGAAIYVDLPLLRPS
jgi:two-component system, OmpR family, sensor kinase